MYEVSEVDLWYHNGSVMAGMEEYFDWRMNQ